MKKTKFEVPILPDDHMADPATEAWDKGDYEGFIYCWPHREHLLPFLHARHQMTDKTYYRILGGIISNVYMADYEDIIVLLLNKRSPKMRRHLMSADEQKTLHALPDTITVYRGCRKDTMRGWSWSLELKHARFFAKRHSGRAGVLQGLVHKSDVIAYFSRESEIFLPPDKVASISILEQQDNGAKPMSYHHEEHLRIREDLELDEEYARMFEE